MIISASRRTDIPAFYSDWFMKNIRNGYVTIQNPYNGYSKDISLKVEDVDCIVFWTRNPSNMYKYLDELNEMGYNYYFQYTLTGYPRILEKSVLNPYKSIEVFKKISDKISSNRIIWRYDPIIYCNIVNIDEHIRLFNKIAKYLNGYTNKVIISFVDLYNKTIRNLNKIDNFKYVDILDKKYIKLLDKLLMNFSDIAEDNNLKIESCSEKIDLSKYDIQHAKCIDGDFIKKEFNLNINFNKDKNQRQTCGCVKSIDIGMYNSCLHGCEYCYANENKDLVKKNYKMFFKK